MLLERRQNISMVVVSSTPTWTWRVGTILSGNLSKIFSIKDTISLWRVREQGVGRNKSDIVTIGKYKDQINLQTGPLQVPDSDGGSRCCWRQLYYAIQTRLKAPKAPFRRHFLPFFVSLWHKSAYNRFFLCMEATYNAITLTTHWKKMGNFTCLEVCSLLLRQHSKVQPMRAQYLDESGPMRVLHSVKLWCGVWYKWLQWWTLCTTVEVTTTPPTGPSPPTSPPGNITSSQPSRPTMNWTSPR